MIECREIVDTVKQEAALSDKTVATGTPNIVLDKHGKVCNVCTDMQAEFAYLVPA